MNIMFCGDSYIADGVLISTLSILKHISSPIHIYILTLDCKTAEKHYMPLPKSFAERLGELVRSRHSESSVSLYDLTEEFAREVPTANMSTSFTPPCMLRLFADSIEELPDKLLYLDSDVVCRGDFSGFYNTDMDGVELAGVLDHYGKWFFRRDPLKMDYLNSGVLLFNMSEIKRSGLFARAREMCRTKKMFMPDQSALNKLAERKVRVERKYNEQRRMRDDTVFRHFTTHFRFFPVFRTVKVKPWQTEKMHKTLKLYEFDDILDEYERLMREYETERNISA